MAARVAPLTSRIGLVPVATVTHTEPFHVSKALATLDYVSSGRAGWRAQVLSIRTGAGAIEFPTKREAQSHEWDDAERALVKDRVDTQFVGSPGAVARRLQQLQEATDADELLITTITHEHADRVRSYGLLADIWADW